MKPAKRLSPLQMLCRVVFPMIFIVGVALIFVRPRERMPASAVAQEVYELALRPARSHISGSRPGGQVGSLWISATAYDPAAGQLEHLRIEGGAMLIVAKRARLVIDAEDDTIRFEMWDVATMRVDDPTDNGGLPVEMRETMHFGPFAYGNFDIVADSKAPRPRLTSAHPATRPSGPATIRR